jgi:hypothetical protein
MRALAPECDSWKQFLAILPNEYDVAGFETADSKEVT